jgi:hypothetical protein
MKLTSVRLVSPRMTRKVVRIATPAISSGTRASSEPNTNASTASAPSPPSSVSASTPPPSASPPPASWPIPVTWRVADGGSAPRIAAPTAGPRSGPPKPDGGGNTSPKVVRPSAATNRRSPVDAHDTTRSRGSAATAPKARSSAARTPGSSTVLPAGRVTTGTIGTPALPPVP